MKMSVSISALQRNTAQVIRRITATGKSEDITDHGRIVATLNPPPIDSGIYKLRNAGNTRPGSWEFFPDIVVAIEGLPQLDLGSALLEQRDIDK